MPETSGFAYWSARVLEELNNVSHNFDPDPVHDLRVALRRCRSVADAFRAVDPDRDWKQVKKLGKELFRRLGEIRDIQVMQDWVNQLGDPEDAVGRELLKTLAEEEAELKANAQTALNAFARKQWETL